MLPYDVRILQQAPRTVQHLALLVGGAHPHHALGAEGVTNRLQQHLRVVVGIAVRSELIRNKRSQHGAVFAAGSMARSLLSALRTCSSLAMRCVLLASVLARLAASEQRKSTSCCGGQSVRTDRMLLAGVKSSRSLLGSEWTCSAKEKRCWPSCCRKASLRGGRVRACMSACFGAQQNFPVQRLRGTDKQSTRCRRITKLKRFQACNLTRSWAAAATSEVQQQPSARGANKL